MRMHQFRSLLRPTASRAWVYATLTGIGGGVALAEGHSTLAPPKATSSVARFLYQPLSKDKTPRNSIEFDTSARMRQRMEAMVFRVQDEICAGIEAVDGCKFQTDNWERGDNGGGGRSRVLQDGKVFEKAGVGVSVVHGMLKPAAQVQMRSRGKPLEEGKDLPFYACGISLVMHPRNPMCPTIHLNYRIFEVETGRKDKHGNPVRLTWFGGGADLTPSYVFEEDARHFHAVYKTILDERDPTWYPKMKKACDEYFYLPHRQEGRGIGGFFFDDLEDVSEATFQTIRKCANAMLDSYVPIVLRRKDMPFTPEQKEWQQIRRGRYVEFNVMVDRGTKFGLATPGSRVESILMSLPLTARWEYNQKPTKGTWEDRSLEVFKQPVDWMEVPPIELDAVATKELLAEIARRTSD